MNVWEQHKIKIPFIPSYTNFMILNLLRHCLIYDPDSSPSCTVLYMILILPRQYLIVHENRRYTFGKVRVGRNKWYLYFMLFTYGEESGSYIRQWRGRFRIICKSDREESGSYIRQWRGKIRIIAKVNWSEWFLFCKFLFLTFPTKIPCPLLYEYPQRKTRPQYWYKIVYQYCNVFHHFCIVMEVYLRMCVIKSPKFLIIFFIIIKKYHAPFYMNIPKEKPFQTG
jgi:hypothetical protein